MIGYIAALTALLMVCAVWLITVRMFLQAANHGVIKITVQRPAPKVVTGDLIPLGDRNA